MMQLSLHLRLLSGKSLGSLMSDFSKKDQGGPGRGTVFHTQKFSWSSKGQ